MTSLPEALGLAAASFITGVLVGQFVRFRRIDDGERRLLKPELDRRPFSGPWFKLGLTVLFLAAVGIMVHATATQRLCNNEFQRTIIYRADTGADDARARKENEKALSVLMTGFLTIQPGPDARDETRAMLERYNRTIAENTARQEANEKRRADNPYPRC
jgi:hypothetical protein